MSTRQAIQVFTAAALILGLSSCTSPASSPTPTPLPPTITPSPTSTSTPAPTLTPTPPACLSQPGRLEQGTVETTNPDQMFLIYLPPCYDEQTDLRYPVLYLLHGQTYTDDQWVRLGAVDTADRLILSGQALPFLIVFPDDRSWNLEAGPGFGDRLIEGLIPYVDAHFRTLADREHRALGGLSRGGGWTVRLGLTHPELFGELGLHSPAIFTEDAPEVQYWMAAIPPDQFPRMWLDIGDRDKELHYVSTFENQLSQFAVNAEFHVYSGDHTESYWGLHVEEYLRWYTQAWTPAAEEQ